MFHIPTRLREKLKYSDRLWPVFAVTVFVALAVTVSSSEFADVSMKTSTSAQDRHLFRIDKFKVPAVAGNEFLDRVRSTHQLLRTQPGFVRDGIYEQTEGPGLRIGRVSSWSISTPVTSMQSCRCTNQKRASSLVPAKR